MVKEPVLGRVKSRLAREIGPVAATAFYRANLAAVIARLGRDARWRTELAIAPDAAVVTRAVTGSVARRGQGQGDLGERMQRILNRVPPGPALVVGTDIPAISAAHIAEAFRRLRGHDAVLGPTPDGGYWLVGLARVPRTPSRIFTSVRWSGPHALADTCANLSAKRVAFAPRLRDVDEAHDLRAERAMVSRRVLPVR